MKSNIVLLLSGLLVLLACSDDAEVPGRLTPIGLEKEEIVLNASDKGMAVRTQSTDWFILGGQTIIEGDTSFFKNLTYNLTTDQVADVMMYKDTFAGEWFKAIKNNEELKVEVVKNEASVDRILILHLSGGNKLDEYLKVVQKAI